MEALIAILIVLFMVVGSSTIRTICYWAIGIALLPVAWPFYLFVFGVYLVNSSRR